MTIFGRQFHAANITRQQVVPVCCIFVNIAFVLQMAVEYLGRVGACVSLSHKKDVLLCAYSPAKKTDTVDVIAGIRI